MQSKKGAESFSGASHSAALCWCMFLGSQKINRTIFREIWVFPLLCHTVAAIP